MTAFGARAEGCVGNIGSTHTGHWDCTDGENGSPLPCVPPRWQLKDKRLAMEELDERLRASNIELETAAKELEAGKASLTGTETEVKRLQERLDAAERHGHEQRPTYANRLFINKYVTTDLQRLSYMVFSHFFVI